MVQVLTIAKARPVLGGRPVSLPSVSLSAVSGWFREYRKARPAKQPTAEQALGIKEFLEDKRG